MKRILWTVAASLACNGALAQELTLVCKGWEPYYQNFANAPVNPSSDNNDFVIDLDLKKRTATYATQIGKMVTPIKDENREYVGTSIVGVEAGGKHISSIGFTANRMTGATNVTYHFREAGEMKVLFSGKCAQGKPLF